MYSCQQLKPLSLDHGLYSMRLWVSRRQRAKSLLNTIKLPHVIFWGMTITQSEL